MVDRWRWFNGRTLSVLAATAVLAVLIVAHVPWVNGPSYFPWPWRRLHAAPLFPLLACAFVPFVAAQRLFDRGKVHVAVPIGLLMAVMFVLMCLCVAVQSVPFGLDRMAQVIESPSATSYFTDARRLAGLSDWLARFHELSPQFNLHSLTKPPGPILTASTLLSTADDAAFLLGLAICAIATLGLPAAYVMSRVLGADACAAFAAASLLALAPGLVLFCPEFDQVYTVLSCGMVSAWVASLERKRVVYAVIYGAFLSVATLFAYNLLVLGAFLAMYSLVWLFRAPREHAFRLALHVAVVMAVVLSFYLAMHMATGFDPVATFQSALANQAKLLELIERPYPATILFDLLDFALGMGWLPVGLAAATLSRRLRAQWSSDRTTWAVGLTAVQVAIVAANALLPGETARVWIFLMPLVAFAAGLELAKWRGGERLVVYASMWLLLALVCQNMTFIAL